MIIRQEQPSDFESIFKVETAAFGKEDEANIVEKIRKDNAIVSSLVAIIDEAIVGHALYSKGVLKSKTGEETAVALGPIAVHPDHQKAGIGASLIKAGNQACLEAGYEFVFVLGHTTYYPKFGFNSTVEHNIHCEFKVPPDVFMVAELKKGALANKQGTFHYHKAFHE